MKKILFLLILIIFSCKKESLRDCSKYEIEYETFYQSYMSYKIIYDSNPTNSNKFKMDKSKEISDSILKEWDDCKMGY